MQAGRICSLFAGAYASQVVRSVDSYRRDGRVAEGARLESVFTRKGNVGSNPTLSASFLLSSLQLTFLLREHKGAERLGRCKIIRTTLPWASRFWVDMAWVYTFIVVRISACRKSS